MAEYICIKKAHTPDHTVEVGTRWIIEETHGGVYYMTDIDGNLIFTDDSALEKHFVKVED